MGIHPDPFAFRSRSTDLVEARRAMWLWAEPVIIDLTIGIYGKLLDDAGTVAMARRHCRNWRKILFDEPVTVGPVLADSAQTAEALGLPALTVEAADDAILDELVDIVTGRYRCSRDAIKTFSLVLMAATSSLSAARAA